MSRAATVLCTFAVLSAGASAAKEPKHDTAWVRMQLARFAPTDAPYRLRARLELVADDGTVIPGVFERLWASSTEWREEIRVADYKDSVGATGGRTWTSQSLPFRPWNVRLVTGALQFQRVDGVEPHLDLRRIPAREGRPDLVCAGVRDSWACVDAEQGVPILREQTTLHVRFDYGALKEFARGSWPSEVRLIDAGREIGRVVVERFEPFDATELLKMAPPAGAEMLFPCKDSRNAELDPHSKVKPKYPPELLHLREEGYAYLQIGIDEAGRVINPQPLRSNHPRFAEAAVEAVRQWRYRPAVCDGKPRKVQSEVMVTFER